LKNIGKFKYKLKCTRKKPSKKKVKDLEEVREENYK
jgi:hypothetical protein